MNDRQDRGMAAVLSWLYNDGSSSAFGKPEPAAFDAMSTGSLQVSGTRSLKCSKTGASLCRLLVLGRSIQLTCAHALCHQCGEGGWTTLPGSASLAISAASGLVRAVVNCLQKRKVRSPRHLCLAGFSLPLQPSC